MFVHLACIVFVFIVVIPLFLGEANIGNNWKTAAWNMVF